MGRSCRNGSETLQAGALGTITIGTRPLGIPLQPATFGADTLGTSFLRVAAFEATALGPGTLGAMALETAAL